MAQFSIDLSGRIRNFDLPKNKPLIPLYEAIVNSIYAIEERQIEDAIQGKIEIKIIREPQQILENEQIDNSVSEIMGFDIIDNGIGLDERNMSSFLQSDSTYRAEKGGKGVGRFSWLKAFKMARIDSSFIDDGEWVQRKFDFTLEQKEINDQLIDIEPREDYKTIVRLSEYLNPYKKNAPRKAEIIAMKIIQHCFIYFMSKECPDIFLIDDERYNLNEIFEKHIKRESDCVELNVSGEKLSLLHTKIEDESYGASRVYLFANNRMVREINIEKEIIDLDKNLYKERGYFYVGVLSGDYLDENVGVNRTLFDIPEKSEKPSDISMKSIVFEVKDKIEEYLADYLNEIKSKKNERVKKYINYEAPQFKHLIKYMPKEIAKIKPNLSDSKLDDELYKIKRNFNNKLKKDNNDILNTIEVGMVNLDVYEEQFSSQIEKISEANKSVLSEYVAHRKIILELLRKGIASDDFGKYSKEEFIHNIVYPMRRTSDEIEYQSHNLWLIDERMAYCEYISSDVPFNNSPKEGRADILMLDKPVAVSDSARTGMKYESITIIELKRPMRNDYNPGNNPIIQMLDYVDKIKTNKVCDRNGRPIMVGESTQFYLYAVCDITSSLTRVAEQHDLIYTPDKMGMYKYHDKKNAYIEILSFDKIIADADKRNRILFDKLGI